MTRAFILGGAGVVVVAVAIALLYRETRETEAPPETAQPPAEKDAPSEPETAASEQAAAPERMPEAPPAGDLPPLRAPSFDVVRINPEGDTVIAGRAEPGTTVTILDGDTPLGDVTSDSRGEWVFLPQEPLPPGSRELSLVARADDGREAASEDVVVLMVPEPKPGAPAEAPLAVVVGRADAPKVEAEMSARVMQTPGAAPPGERPTVSFDVIEYDDAGGTLRMSGQAPAGAEILVYLDNELLGRATADDQGRWELVPGREIAPGRYRLRADMVAPDGKVLARASIPFERSAPTAVAAAEGAGVWVVQPGNSLWRIARRRYGRGIEYWTIYDANKTQIDDPDLIYPGQVFVLPPS